MLCAAEPPSSSSASLARDIAAVLSSDDGDVPDLAAFAALHDRNSRALAALLFGMGTFGIIANESEPFCSACTRLRLSSDGYLYGCLSSPRRHSIRDLLTLPSHLVFPQLQARLLDALNVKQQTFQGETTIMKFIGG